MATMLNIQKELNESKVKIEFLNKVVISWLIGISLPPQLAF